MTTDTDYIVESREHGIAVFGAVPVTEARIVLKQCEREDCDLIDARISGALDACFVATDREGQRKWRKSLDLEVTNE